MKRVILGIAVVAAISAWGFGVWAQVANPPTAPSPVAPNASPSPVPPDSHALREDWQALSNQLQALVALFNHVDRDLLEDAKAWQRYTAQLKAAQDGIASNEK